ncbi:ribonuclease HII [Conchiformibius kuhniae]|uniref:Ribonuclease HII n=1 Tax=Conchiformibius kuhniae TaxID=211502 RepID=A0A8T9MUH0_9NEIS|nr:ribonuclease HII [Conchiformibius kuhniae]UOP04485.1 ribonuclease HII [Conchiformibius kuhniae]
MGAILQAVAWHDAGVDEAGRGCLAGSVFAAAVMLPPDFALAGLTDSKKLSEARRDRFAAEIKRCAAAWCVASANVDEIDTLNILHATMLAMRRAVSGLGRLPEKVWVDGNRIPDALPCAAEAVVGGDARIVQIAAASVLAKTARDAEMYALAERFPHYGFERHKGYGTAAHLAALREHGALPEHRRSFAPVKAVLERGA